MLNRLFFVGACTLLTSSMAVAAPTPLPNAPISLELKQASAANVYQLLGTVGHRNFSLTRCAAEKTLTIKVTNVPFVVAVDAVTTKLGLHRQTIGRSVFVRCVNDEVKIDLDRRLTLDLKDMALSSALNLVAEAIGLSGAVVEGDDASITLSLTRVRAETMLEAILESASFEQMWVQDKMLYVARAPAE